MDQKSSHACYKARHRGRIYLSLQILLSNDSFEGAFLYYHLFSPLHDRTTAAPFIGEKQKTQ
jgi:hypothetical protein